MTTLGFLIIVIYSIAPISEHFSAQGLSNRGINCHFYHYKILLP